MNTINPSRVRKSGPLCALGLSFSALILLGGCGGDPGDTLSADVSTTIDRTNDPVVARVDGSPIYQKDVRRAAEAQGLIGAEDELLPNNPIFLTSLDELIDQRLLALDALRTGVASDPEAKRRLAAAQDRILGNYRVERHLEETVTDESIRALYEAQRELAGRGEERRLRRIVLADQETALEVAQRLADEEDFDTLIEDYASDDALQSQSGDMGWVSRNMLSGPVAAQGFSTPVGGRSAPFQVGESWQIIDVLDTRTPLSRSFTDVREDISRFMTYEAVETLMTDLRDRAEIERVDPETLMGSEAQDLSALPETDLDPDSDPQDETP